MGGHQRGALHSKLAIEVSHQFFLLDGMWGTTHGVIPS
jgi:hypothetical protein